VPLRLRPTAPTAEAAILVGDPGRALLLAQALLEQPKMSNHARGLWGYHGETADGHALTIQSTGMGGPSAALVLADLAELGVRRAVRVGSCVGLTPEARLGSLLIVSEAIAVGGSAGALGIEMGTALRPDEPLREGLASALADGGVSGTVVSVDAHPAELGHRPDAIAADMQTAPLLAQSARLGVAAAAVLIVSEAKAEADPAEALDRDSLEEVERRAGRAAQSALST
jgi:uridine phosphorylase